MRRYSYMLFLSVPFILEDPFWQTLTLSSCLLYSIFFCIKALLSKSLMKSIILSLKSHVFFLPRCPICFCFLFLFFLNPDILLKCILQLVHIEKCAFSIGTFIFCLTQEKIFLIILFSICSAPLLQFPFSGTPIIHIVRPSLPIFDTCQFHMNPFYLVFYF